MATSVKTFRTLQASATNAAAATTTSSTWTLTTALGGLLTTKITNGGTGPTVACTVTVNVSGDGSAWKYFAAATAGTTASAVFEFPVEIPPGAMYVQVVFSGNTAQGVSVEAFGQELTSIG